MKAKIFLAVTMIILTVTSCKKADDMPFSRVASPVLVITKPTIKTETSATIAASFYTLDKSGILDSSVGIDSIPVTGLKVEVFTNARTKIAEATTDGNGAITLELSKDLFEAVTSFSWAGSYNDIAFSKSQSY